MKFTEAQCFFLLGIANWCIFLNHVPSDMVSLLTLRKLGLSGPVDLLVFAAGYSAAVTYGTMVSERGLVVAATRVWGRALRLYGAYLVLFVAYVAVIAYVASRSSAPRSSRSTICSASSINPFRFCCMRCCCRSGPATSMC